MNKSVRGQLPARRHQFGDFSVTTPGYDRDFIFQFAAGGLPNPVWLARAATAARTVARVWVERRPEKLSELSAVRMIGMEEQPLRARRVSNPSGVVVSDGTQAGIPIGNGPRGLVHSP